LLQILTSNAPYIILGFFGILFAAVLSVVSFRIYMTRKRGEFIKNFPEYMGVLNFHMEKAYEMIHKDRILVYSLEAQGLDDKNFNIASQDFVRLVIKLLGPMLYNEFVFLYGDIDTFTFNVLEYFNTKYESDEIRQTAIENLGEDED